MSERLTDETAALKLLVGKTPGSADWLWPVTITDVERALSTARTAILPVGPRGHEVVRPVPDATQILYFDGNPLVSRAVLRPEDNPGVTFTATELGTGKYAVRVE